MLKGLNYSQGIQLVNLMSTSHMLQNTKDIKQWSSEQSLANKIATQDTVTIGHKTYKTQDLTLTKKESCCNVSTYNSKGYKLPQVHKHAHVSFEYSV